MVPRVTPATVHATSLTTTQTDNQVRQVITRLNMLYPNRTKLLALTNQFAKISDMRAYKLEWGEQADPPRVVEVKGTTSANGVEVGAGVTTIFVTPALAVLPDEVLHDDRSGEDLRIVSNTAGALVVGTRGTFGGGPPLTMPEGTKLRIMGAAKAENAAASLTKATTPTIYYNHPQTFERDIATSTLAAAIQMYLSRGGNLRQNDQIVAMDDFKWGIEQTALFGNRSSTLDASSRAIYKAGGVEYWVRAANNFHDINGAFTYPNFDDIMTDHARVGGGGLYFGFCSHKVCNIMRRWSLDYHRSDYMMSQRTKTFGLLHDRFGGANYQMMIMQHEAFEESDVRVQQLMIIKANNFKMHYMRGLGPETNKAIQGPAKDGTHGYKDQITATGTFEIPLPEGNCIIRNIES